jgi:pimeloyl-ACP methyl ester carboxylesterase
VSAREEAHARPGWRHGVPQVIFPAGAGRGTPDVEREEATMSEQRWDEDGATPFAPAARWGAVSEVADLDGPVHWVDFGGPDDPDRPPLVLVHGLGGSHLNWVKVAPALARRTRVVALDLAGFGLTPTAGRSASVHANAELLHRFVRRVVGRPAVLVGNSMGGMVSLLCTAAHRDAAAGVVLVDPSVPQTVAMLDREVAIGIGSAALPLVGARIARWTRSRTPARQTVQRVVDLCFADPSRADPEVIEAGVSLVEHRLRLPPEDRAFSAAARSLTALSGNRFRYAAVLRKVRVPVLLVHGSEDRLVARAAADAVAATHPAWEYVVLDGVGHTPQLEAPDAFLAAVHGWLDRTDLLPAT